MQRKVKVIMGVSDTEFDKIIHLITQHTGIIPKDSHKLGIKRYINSRLETLWAQNSKDGHIDYYTYLLTDKEEVLRLVNGSTINETYFFREQQQFSFLNAFVFPNFIKNAIKPRIWSAACSSGEEIYSLLLLSKSLRINASFTASDINTDVLETCKNGIYGPRSLRMGDGAIFHHLLHPYKKTSGNIEFPRELRECIKCEVINLSNLASPLMTPQTLQALPTEQNIIFIRNVFIYFTREMRALILKTIAQKCLASGGYLFVSMNEIPSIDASIIPSELQKLSEGNVFYFQKKA